MVRILVIRFHEKGRYEGNKAGIAGLKNAYSRGTIETGIGLRM